MSGGDDAAAREHVENFILQLAKDRNLAQGAYSFVWWERERAGPDPGTGGAPISLRVYCGNRWRQIAFAGPDLDACIRSPEVLQKYEEDIVEILLNI
jgi:hypothetical protein